MYKLGYDPESMLWEAAATNSEYDMEDVQSTSGVIRAVVVASRSHYDMKDVLAAEEEGLLPHEMAICFLDDMAVDPMEEQSRVRAVLADKINEAVALGCSAEFAEGLALLLKKHVNVFRLTLGRDPPIDMPSLKVRLVPGAKAVRCKARRYSLPQREFMQQHVKDLEASGFIYRNASSRWASAPLIVRKPHTKDEFRMTVDLRPLNAQTEHVAWPMPILEVVVNHLSGAQCFFLLDFFKGYCQFALDTSCQEMFSLLTDTAVYTSTRVMQGGSDSTSYCQSTVHEMFKEQLYHGLLVWLDDLLGYQHNQSGLLGALGAVLEICTVKGLKLHPKKCQFYVKEAKWYGRIISGSGVKHDPMRIDALRQLPVLVTGADLQQYVCEINWMRMILPGYNVLMQPLTEVLQRVYAENGGRRTRQLAATVKLVDVGWENVHVRCLEETKLALSNLVELSHPDSKRQLCVFADASESHWGAVISPVPQEHMDLLFEEQDHQPLMFLSGTFT